MPLWSQAGELPEAVVSRRREGLGGQDTWKALELDKGDQARKQQQPATQSGEPHLQPETFCSLHFLLGVQEMLREDTRT